jgi:ABC-2 type transport system ATP-binding protein
MIEVKNLLRKYGEKIAVHNISFSVERGKIWGFLGPNGAGKTTTMRILTGYLPPTEGEAYIAGYDVVKYPLRAKTHIGYLPEIPPLYNDMTVRGYIGFVAELKGMKGKEKQRSVGAAIEKTGLESVKKRLIKNLSKGFRQRVGIAQAIVNDPDVLILDEPTIGLDPAQIIEIRELIKSLKENHTVILSTHILTEVTQTCDGVVIINEGQLRASGSISELREKFKEQKGIYLETVPPLETEQLNMISGIKAVEPDGNGYKIFWEDEQIGEKSLFEYIKTKDIVLKEWRIITPTLEDLYLKIVSSDKGGVQ